MSGSCVSYSATIAGESAAEGILDDLAVLRGAEQEAEGGIFVRLAVVAVEGFEVDVELAEVLRLEAAGLEFEGDEAVQPAVKKEQVEREILSADLDGILRADEAKVAAQLGEKRPRLRTSAPCRSASECSAGKPRNSSV